MQPATGFCHRLLVSANDIFTVEMVLYLQRTLSSWLHSPQMRESIQVYEVPNEKNVGVARPARFPKSHLPTAPRFLIPLTEHSSSHSIDLRYIVNPHH